MRYKGVSRISGVVAAYYYLKDKGWNPKKHILSFNYVEKQLKLNKEKMSEYAKQSSS